MKHFGDITKINGYDLPPVDIITGGSPCQDLSVAGRRAGLAGERSGLFMEQIRVIKEMRDRDRNTGRTGEFIRPRYMVWENVPGCLSSGSPKGEDFRIVLEETARIADPKANVPRPSDGKWQNAGAIVGDGWSIAWRIHDAQYWGVPQRRRRLALVADFGGGTAPEIQFESESLCRDSETSGEETPRTAGSLTNRTQETSSAVMGGGTPRVRDSQGPSRKSQSPVPRGQRDLYFIEMTSTKNTVTNNGISFTLTGRMGTGGNQVNAVLDKR